MFVTLHISFQTHFEILSRHKYNNSQLRVMASSRAFNLALECKTMKMNSECVDHIHHVLSDILWL